MPSRNIPERHRPAHYQKLPTILSHKKTKIDPLGVFRSKLGKTPNQH